MSVTLTRPPAGAAAIAAAGDNFDSDRVISYSFTVRGGRSGAAASA